jgi:hypothetical protein
MVLDGKEGWEGEWLKGRESRKRKSERGIEKWNEN